MFCLALGKYLTDIVNSNQSFFNLFKIEQDVGAYQRALYFSIISTFRNIAKIYGKLEGVTCKVLTKIYDKNEINVKQLSDCTVQIEIKIFSLKSKSEHRLRWRKHL